MVIKKSLNSFVSENITIKLPNDLLINGHKFWEYYKKH